MNYQTYIDNEFQRDEVKPLYFILFWGGFITYSVFQTANSIYLLTFSICAPFQILGIISLIIGAFNIAVLKIKNSYLRASFIFYFVWLLLIIFRDSPQLTNFTMIKVFLFSPYGSGGLLYFVPLAIFLPKNAVFYRKTFNAIIALGVIFLLFDIVMANQLLVAGDNPESQEMLETLSVLSVPCGFILCTYVYHSKFRNLVALAIVGLTLLLALIRARRGLSLYCSSILFFAYLIYFYNSKKKYIHVYALFLFFCVESLYLNNMTYHIRENRILGFFAERGDDDTRTGIEWYFYNDMQTKDWTVGKGILGDYYCPDISESQQTNFRDDIETGYLQIILKGGIVSLLLFLLISIPAIIKGIFFSRNTLAKASGVWILLFISTLYPRDETKFTLNYILVWMSIGLCYNKNLRNLQEEEIIGFLEKDNKNLS
ncbi:MAG: hypothetical protein ACTHKY_15805 [Ginsengibacter sp.]|jgi:hypothetical protein